MSLGTRVDLSHDAATPPGMEVVARVRLEGVDGRRLTFSAQADGRARRDLHGHARALRGRPRAASSRGWGARPADLRAGGAGRVANDPRPAYLRGFAGSYRHPATEVPPLPRTTRPPLAAALGALLLAVALLAVAVPTALGAPAPFALRYSANAPGDIAIVGNTVLTCPATAAACAGGAGRGGRPEQQLRHAVRGRGRRPGDLQLQLRAARPARRGDRALRRALLGRPDRGGRGTRRRGSARHGRHRHGGHGRARRRHGAGRRRGGRHHHRQRGQLPGVRRRHRARAGRRRRQLRGVERAGRPGHQHLGRLVAGGGLPRPGGAAAQPVGVRRLPVREPLQPGRHDPGQRLPRAPERPRARAARRRGLRRRPRLARARSSSATP